jgi:hypothetical protein
MAEPRTLLPDIEAERWAAELDAFAYAREDRTELNGLVRDARKVADSIRDLARELRDARAGNDTATTGILLENLGSLRKRALEILGGRASA